MAEPLISIVVPIYNAEFFIKKCIQSLIDQTYSNIQIILVNDGSQDESLSICKSFKELDSRVLVIDQKNQGVSRARSAGIEAADGEYIGFVDSDDFIEPEMYQVLLSKLRSEGSQCATLIDFTVKPPNQSIVKSKSPIDNIEAIGELFLLRFPTSMWAYLYKTDLVKDIKLDDDIHFFEDFEFNYKYFKACDKISICKGAYYNYNNNPQSVNQQEINYKKISCLSIYDKIKESFSEFNNEDLNKKSIFFRAHFIVSMILSFSLSSQNARKSFYIILSESVDSVSNRSFLYSKYVPLSYKLMVFLFSVSPVFAEKIIGCYKRFR